MFKIFKRKKVESPVDFVDVGGYSSARIQQKPQSSGMTSDGYVAIPAPSSTASAPADTDFLGAMASAASSAASQTSDSSTSFSSAVSSPQDSNSYKILRKLSHLADRIDLIEKKIDRIERKTGVTFDEI